MRKTADKFRVELINLTAIQVTELELKFNIHNITINRISREIQKSKVSIAEANRHYKVHIIKSPQTKEKKNSKQVNSILIPVEESNKNERKRVRKLHIHRKGLKYSQILPIAGRRLKPVQGHRGSGGQIGLSAANGGRKKRKNED